MKKLICSLLLAWAIHGYSQTFISAGKIEFESKKAVKKAMDFGDNDDGFWKDLISKLPPFTTNYFSYTFGNNKSLYKFERNTDKQKLPQWFQEDYSEDIYYNDNTTGTFIKKIAVQYDATYLVQGNQPNMTWKIYPNDNTVIAGFNCRKASTVLFDSVYIFAYYSDEIAISGGPMNLHGLPGMILGVTIPRLYTSWVATSVVLNTQAGAIAPPTKGKKKTETELQETFLGFKKTWGKEQQKYINPTYWKTFL